MSKTNQILIRTHTALHVTRHRTHWHRRYTPFGESVLNDKQDEYNYYLRTYGSPHDAPHDSLTPMRHAFWFVLHNRCNFFFKKILTHIHMACHMTRRRAHCQLSLAAWRAPIFIDPILKWQGSFAEYSLFYRSNEDDRCQWALSLAARRARSMCIYVYM